MDAITPLILAKALDGLSARYTATAENIANANTPNYRPVQVRFEEALRAAAEQGAAAVTGVEARTEAAPMPKIASEMRLDLEIATASQTAGRYMALTELLARSMQIQRTAMGGDR